MKKIVILGGGFGGVEFYRTAHKELHGLPTVAFQMISRWNYFLFYPMLHEVATGSVERSHITEPLREIIDCCVEKFLQAEITQIDFEKKIVTTNQGSHAYDYLIVSLGVQPNYFNIPGADEHCISFKSIADAVTVRNHVIHHYELAAHEHDEETRKTLLSFVVIGGGPTGVELAGQLADLMFHEMRELYPDVNPDEVKITLIDGGDQLLKQFHPELGHLAELRLKKMGVNIMLNTRAIRCEADKIHLEGDGHVPGSLRIWAAGTKSTLVELVDSKYLTKRGFLQTTETLQLVDHPEVFVIGDNMEITSPNAYMVPQTGQAASATARHAAKNFVALLRNKKLQPFKFASKGDIIPIGDWYAVAELGGFRFFGPLAWIMRRVVFIQRLASPLNRAKVTLDWMLHAVLKRDTSEL
ncbi:MAG: NAD(P)/FAD-dependent oxidoreductase [Candidatus Magasanikbacteria bacterium]|nr:NAD(P)/FAD-dependent oxidoreductase [Candidatus Magasanikbacteria bacterium]